MITQKYIGRFINVCNLCKEHFISLTEAQNHVDTKHKKIQNYINKVKVDTSIVNRVNKDIRLKLIQQIKNDHELIVILCKFDDDRKNRNKAIRKIYDKDILNDLLNSETDIKNRELIQSKIDNKDKLKDFLEG